MRWIIEGADANTGQDVRVEVDAADERGAHLAARKRRIMVASIRPAPDPVVSLDAMGDAAEAAPTFPTIEDLAADAVGSADYGRPIESTAPIRPPDGPTAPAYADIIASAKRVRIFGNVIEIIGWLHILGGLLIGAYIAAMASLSGDPYHGLFAALIVLAGVLWGLLFIGLASVFQLFAGMGMVLRDIGRNSFRR